MQQTVNMTLTQKLLQLLWPIERRELKKFLPMAIMMACIIFNYALLRSVKDGLVITSIGAEAISFLKTYFVLPSAVLFMIKYAKLCNIMSPRKVFYTITSIFIGYLALFAFVLYPNPEFFHMAPATVEALAAQFPNFQWFIRIIGSWTYATMYVMAEMWGAMMLTLLFWQFANQITTSKEAKRFYGMFGLFGALAMTQVKPVVGLLLNSNIQLVPENVKLIPIFCVMIGLAMVVMYLYHWMNKHVLTDPTLCPSEGGAKKKKKAKLSLKDSFKMITTSKYLGLIAALILCYGISINLVEGVWKAQVKLAYPTVEAYTTFMSSFMSWQGWASILFILVGSNILRRVSWSTAALFTPIMIMVTGLAFFSFIFFGSTAGLHIAAFFGTGPLAVVVTIGMIQNVMSKATKYSLFDATKEMAYIPLDEELKTKGKAAVDVIGGRFGKSGGGIIQSTFFMLLPSYTFNEALPFFAGVFFLVVLAWVFAVKGLSTKYHALLAEHEAIEAAEAMGTVSAVESDEKVEVARAAREALDIAEHKLADRAVGLWGQIKSTVFRKKRFV